jgi:hypothetical protein
MDYPHILQQLMKQFPQLVIFDLKETELCSHVTASSVYDLSTSTKRLCYAPTHNLEPIAVVIDDPMTGNADHDRLNIIYNLYGALVRKQKQCVSPSEMERLSQELTEHDRQIHWIWFREKGFHLPDKIIHRARSWIELNPDFKCYLWTNLVDRLELDDFLLTLSQEHRNLFEQGKIIVKYQHETFSCVTQFIEHVDPQQRHVLLNLFEHHQPITTAEIKTSEELQRHITTTIITTEQKKPFKIDRIFKTDILRIILLFLHGGIYCDFNDTVCFYPMKYLLTFYRDQFFVGTDYDTDHPIYRNNYFLYTSFKNRDFISLGLRCVTKAINEYIRITNPSYAQQYYQLGVSLFDMIKDTPSGSSILTQMVNSPDLQQIIKEDKLKDIPRVLGLIADLYEYMGLTNLSQKLKQELDAVDLHSLKNAVIRLKTRRRNRHHTTQETDAVVNGPRPPPFNGNHEFYDYFLIKYAIHMTIGDLILSTNIAYTDEITNLVPFLRINRLSTISMLTHFYDGTSYGLEKKYGHTAQNEQDLRQLLF